MEFHKFHLLLCLPTFIKTQVTINYIYISFMCLERPHFQTIMQHFRRAIVIKNQEIVMEIFSAKSVRTLVKSQCPHIPYQGVGALYLNFPTVFIIRFNSRLSSLIKIVKCRPRS